MFPIYTIENLIFFQDGVLYPVVRNGEFHGSLVAINIYKLAVSATAHSSLLLINTSRNRDIIFTLFSTLLFCELMAQVVNLGIYSQSLPSPFGLILSIIILVGGMLSLVILMIGFLLRVEEKMKVNFVWVVISQDRI